MELIFCYFNVIKKNMVQTTNRYNIPDLIKGIAVIFMIQVHLTELFALEEIYRGLVGKISLFLGGPPAAPLFMAVMGYFLARTKKTRKDLFLRGLKLLFIGLLLNIGMNLNLLIQILRGIYNLEPLKFIFGVDILFLAGMSIITVALIQPLLDKSFWFTLLLAFLFALLSDVLSSYRISNDGLLAFINAFLWGNYEWSYFPFIPWFAYPLLGYSFHGMVKIYSCKFNFNTHQTLLIIFTWLLGLWISRKYVLAITSNLHDYYHHGILMFVWIFFFLIGFVLVIYLVDKHFSHNKISSYIMWLGRNVTAAYVFQWLLIGNIATELYKTQNLLALIIWFVVILALVSTLIIIFEKNKRNLKNSLTKFYRYLSHG
jgi:surface polysaccharide O-acyltransferase-like enzyme